MTPMESNLRSVLSKATPTDVQQGKDWYNEAHQYAKQLSNEHRISMRRACAVIAALSPRNRWERNKVDADNLIRWARNPVIKPTFGTFGPNVDKAYRIATYDGYLSDKLVLAILKGPKVVAFFFNIYDPDKPHVTVDTHMHLAVGEGKYLPVEERPNLTAKTMKQIADTVINVSKELGLRPCEVQAIAWIVWKRENES